MDNLIFNNKKQNEIIKTRHEDFDLESNFYENYNELAERKLKEYLGNEVNSELQAENNQIEDVKVTYYERKIDKYKKVKNTLNAVKAGQNHGYDKLTYYKNTSKRIKESDTALEHLNNAQRIFDDIVNAKQRLNDNPRNKDKIIKNIYDLEDKLLDERYKASKHEIMANAIDSGDEAIRLNKAKLTKLACQLKMYKDRNLGYTDKYIKILNEYKKIYNELGENQLRKDNIENHREKVYRKKDLSEFENRDRANYLNHVLENKNINQLAYCVSWLAANKKLCAEDMNSFNYLRTEEGRKFLDNNAIETRFRMIIESFAKDNKMITRIAKFNFDNAPVIYSENKSITEEEYHNHFFNIKNKLKWDSKSEEEYTKACRYYTEMTPFRDKNIKMETKSLFRHYHYKDSVDNLPLQGWKMHIGARSARDFFEMARILIPEFTKYRFSFKIVEPKYQQSDLILNSYKDNTVGKEITIYPSENLDFNLLSDKAKEILKLGQENTQATRITATDIKLQDSRITRRYAAMYGHNIMNDKCEMIFDNREKAMAEKKKEAKNEEQIEYFPNKNAEKISQTNESCMFYKNIKMQYETGKISLNRYLNQYMLFCYFKEDISENDLPLGVQQIVEEPRFTKKLKNKKGELENVIGNSSDNSDVSEKAFFGNDFIVQNYGINYYMDKKSGYTYCVYPKKIEGIVREVWKEA